MGMASWQLLKMPEDWLPTDSRACRTSDYQIAETQLLKEWSANPLCYSFAGQGLRRTRRRTCERAPSEAISGQGRCGVLWVSIDLFYSEYDVSSRLPIDMTGAHAHTRKVKMPVNASNNLLRGNRLVQEPLILHRTNLSA